MGGPARLGRTAPRYALAVPAMGARSEVVVDDDGWVWLAPRPASLRRLHVVASSVVAVLVVGVMVVLTLLPGWPGVVASVPPVLVGAAIIRMASRRAMARLALSQVGVVLATQADTMQIGWPAVATVMGTPERGRVRMTIGTRERHVTSQATFDRDAAEDWLGRATAEARRRNLDPVPAPEGLGFTTA